MSRLVSHIPPCEQWRQALLFPAADIREDCVLLNRAVSTYTLWIELPSRKVWGLTLWKNAPCLSFRLLGLVARQLDTANQQELERVFAHLAVLTGCRKIMGCELADINSIAEELAGAEIREEVGSSMSVKLATENILQASRPYKKAFVDGLLLFNKGLAPDIMALLGNEPLLSMDEAFAYNYLIHPVPKIENYRRQAMKTFPLLRDALGCVATDYRCQRLQRNVDSGNPLLPVLMDFLGCRMPVARFLVGKDFSLTGEEWRPQVQKLVDLLGMLNPACWPQTADDWAQISRWLLPVFNALNDSNSMVRPEMLAECLNGLARAGYGKIPARLERHGVILTDITTIPDFERALREWCASAGVRQSRGSEALWQYSILKIAVLSHRWHDWLARRMDDVESVVDKEEVASSGWLTFTGEPWHEDRHTAVPLNYPWALHEEGLRMRHCVGTYVSQCRYFGSHIYSIRDRKSGQSLSTVELRVVERPGDLPNIEVVQHRALENAVPSDECQRTLKELLRYFKATVTREQFMAIREQQFQRRAESAEFKRMYYRPAWPRRMVEEFRELLHGYPLLESVGRDATGDNDHVLDDSEIEALLDYVHHDPAAQI